MVTFTITAVTVLAALVSAWGWGRIVTPICYRRTVGGIRAPMAYVATLGLGALILIGGILNLLHIAYPVALEILFGLGIGIAMVFTALALRRDLASFTPTGLLQRLRPTSWSKLRISGDLVPWIIILAATGFFAATLMPTSAFNFHDDFHKYLVSPFRMLQTGTLGGGPFEVMGRDHLGTQSFFQAFILTRFAPEYINGFDYIFCFLLAGFLLNDIGRKVEVHWLYRSVAMAAFVFIHPQYVNISALYSGALFILATVYGAMLIADTLDAADTKTLSRASIPLGLFLAALISLKATFIPFALALGAMLALGFLVMSESRLRTAAAGGAAVLSMGAVLVPWSAISVNNYANIIAVGLDRIGRKAEMGAQSVADWGRLGDLILSPQDLFYGGWLPAYNLAVLTVAVAALISVYLIWRNRETPVRRYLVIGLSLFAATVVAYLFNAYLFTVKSGRIDVTVRYFTPVLIAAAPVTVLVLGRLFWRAQSAPPGAVVPASLGALAFVMALVLVVGLFSDAFITRAVQVKNYRTDLSFRLAKSKRYLAYNQIALTVEARNKFLGIQSKTEKGEKILAWISVPFLLNFARNPIMTMTHPQIILKKLKKPLNEDPQLLRKFLKATGVRYVMWQFTGFGMKSERSFKNKLRSSAFKRDAQANLDFIDLIKSLQGNSKLIYKGPLIVLLDLGP